jgi:hypothetical protein
MGYQPNDIRELFPFLSHHVKHEVSSAWFFTPEGKTLHNGRCGILKSYTSLEVSSLILILILI